MKDANKSTKKKQRDADTANIIQPLTKQTFIMEVMLDGAFIPEQISLNSIRLFT